MAGWLRRRNKAKANSRSRKLSIEKLEDRALLSLTHWYTFNDGTASDLLGGANGTLTNGASIVAGQLLLQNTGQSSGSGSAQHVVLPADVLPSDDATFEVWYTATNSSNAARVFDIGNQNGAVGDSSLYFTLQTSANDSRAVLRPSGSADRVATADTTDNATERLATIVIDTTADLLRLYIDGVATTTAALTGANAGSINDAVAFLGKSLNNSDPAFTGLINELRIYDEALIPSQIVASATSGPTTALLPGDYDRNNTVDAADLAAWTNNFGSTTALAADGNLSGSVDTADYTLWRDNLGRTATPSSAIVINDETRTQTSVASSTVVMLGRSELHLTSGTSPLSFSTVHLNSPDAWLYLPGVKPSVVNSTYLSQLRVLGSPAVNGSTVRVVQYEQGTVVIPHASNFQPLEAFTGPNFTGAAQSFNQYTYYNTASSLGAVAGNLSSFKLAHGYMATIATQPNGTGSSRVYIAQDGDLEVSLLPTAYDNAVQFVRVFPWRWVAKKGASDYSPTPLEASWFYNWNNNTTSSLDAEYVPIQQQPFWPGAPTNLANSTHWLGFNEPNNPVEDAYQNLNNGSVDAAIAWWPNMLSTGLRVGAPAVTDGGKAWLYEFMDKAIAANLRVDYIAIHNYQAGNSAASLQAWLKDVYDRYKLPIWLTEFNNGANWTGGTDPTYAQNATVIGSFIDMMDNTPWIERYSIYGNVEDVRDVNYPDGSLTPMGVVYRDNDSPNSYLQEGVPTTNNQNRSLAQLSFEENALDTSGFGHNGQIVGTPTFVTGQQGQAIDLNGTNTYVQLPETVAKGDSFTFAAWVNWDGGANWQRIFDFGNDTNQYLFLTPSNGTNLRFAIRNGGTEQTLSSTPLPTGQWRHVAVTIGGGVGRMYVNGSLVATNSAMSIRPGDFDPVRNFLGESQFAADPHYNGRIDEVVITDTVLTQAQIAALATNTAPQFSTPVITTGFASRGTLFTGSVAGLATDADAGDTFTYSKANGPAWLSVAPNGALSGTPTASNQGPQEFVITATDSRGGMSSAVLIVPLEESYWRGDVSNVWTTNNAGNTNWATGPAGTTDTGATPGPTSDVVFASAGAANLSTVLGGDVAVRSLLLSSSSAVTIGGSHNLTLGASGLTHSAGAGAATINTSGQVILDASQTWNANSTNSLTVNSVISGTAGLTKTGSGTLILNGNNIYTSTTTISSGTLQVGSGASSGSLAGNIVNYATLIVDRSTDVTFGGAISGSGSLTKRGAGRLILTGISSYLGDTIVGANTGTGVIRAAANNALGTGAVTIGPGGNAATGRLELANNATLPNAIALPMRNNATAAIQNISGNNRLNGTITLNVGGSTALIQSDAGLLTISGVTSGASGARLVTLAGAGNGAVSGVISNGSGTVSITKTGAGTWTFNSANTYTGVTTVSAGTVALGAAERLANTSTVTLAGGTFSTGGFSETVGALTMSASSAIDFGAGTSTLTFASAASFTAGTTLTLNNWTSGSDRLFIGASATLTPTQLAQITFSGIAAQQLATGEVIPVPAVIPLGVPTSASASVATTTDSTAARESAFEDFGARSHARRTSELLPTRNNHDSSRVATQPTVRQSERTTDKVWSDFGSDLCSTEVAKTITAARRGA